MFVAKIRGYRILNFLILMTMSHVFSVVISDESGHELKQFPAKKPGL